MKLFILLITLVVTSSLNAKTCSSPTEKQIESLEKAAENLIEIKFDATATEYHATAEYVEKEFSNLASQCPLQIVNSPEIKTLNLEQSSRLFETIRIFTFYSNNTYFLELLEQLYVQLTQLSGPNISVKKYVLADNYIKFRDFEKYNAISKNDNKLQTINFYDAANNSARSVMRQSDSPYHLTRETFTLKNKHIVIASHPNCNYSKKAMQYIEHSPRLKKLFKKNSTWLYPVDGNLTLSQVFEHNQSQTFPFVYTYSELEWPEINAWETPSFYFYQDGELQYSFSGWPEEGNNEQLLKGLKTLELTLE